MRFAIGRVPLSNHYGTNQDMAAVIAASERPSRMHHEHQRIRFRCGHCGATVNAPREFEGNPGTCPNCSQMIKVPPPPQQPMPFGGTGASGRLPEPFAGGAAARKDRTQASKSPAADPWI